MKKLILFLSLFSVYAFGQADSNMVEIQGKATIADTDVFIVSGADTVYWKVTYAQIKTLLDALYEGELTNSAGLLAALSDETGTGVAVFGTAPTFTTSITMGSAGLSEAELEILDGATLTTTQLEYLNGATGTTGTTTTNLVYSTSPVLVTPALGTPTALVLTSATGLPYSAVLGLEDSIGNAISDSALTGTTQSGMAMYQTSTSAWSEIAPGAVLDTLAKYATDVEVTSTGIISGGSRTPVTGSTTGFAAGFTGDNLYGGTYVVSSDDGDLQLPLMAAGMNFTIITLGAIQVVAASHADDGYLLDGVTADEDNSIVNTSTSGDIAVIQYYTADDWLITTNGWTAE